MSADQKIPIKNIYYMLCYAWNKLAIDSDVLCGTERFDNIYNLMSWVLIHSVSSLIRCGFHQEYTTREESLTMPRGRIDFKQSLSGLTMTCRRLACFHDCLDNDVLFNQIIRATMKNLASCPEVDPKLQASLRDLNRHFSGISEIVLTKQAFETLCFNRNNQNNQLILHVCRLVFEGFNSREQGNQIRFSQFVRDRQMAALCEKFVLNFYKRHLTPKGCKVSSPKIPWKVLPGSDIRHLPEMRTDIVIESREKQRQLIIDTKFYPEIFARSRFGVNNKLKSENLYQMFTYMNNSPYPGQVSGMLLYPVTNQTLDETYPIEDKLLLVKTLDLNREWPEIENRLLELVNFM